VARKRQNRCIEFNSIELRKTKLAAATGGGDLKQNEWLRIAKITKTMGWYLRRTLTQRVAHLCLYTNGERSIVKNKQNHKTNKPNTDDVSSAPNTRRHNGSQKLLY